MEKFSKIVKFLLFLNFCALSFAQILIPDTQPNVDNFNSRDNSFPYKEKHPTVTLKQGRFLGKTLLSRAQREYYAFLGIRYAKPVLRFQSMAELPSASDEIKNATSYGAFCLQHDWFQNIVVGEEDCLFINVYTPKVAGRNETGTFPVMMYIHGGAFLFGSGNVYLPDYFMDENVILLTMNYRLGVLGFLSTQDSIIQGNMGLKDQIVALKWTHENIHHFSGDPSRITVFGESAGGASVSFHLLSPMAEQGISHSGTALCPWAFVRNPKRVARRFGEFLKCPTNSSLELLSCLRQKDPKDIVTTQEKLTVWNRDPFALFGPSLEILEDDLEEIHAQRSPMFLPDTPFKLLCKRKSIPVPWILGVCKDEGLLFHAATILHNPILTKDLNNNWTRVAPVTLLYDETARDSLYVSKKVRKYYFGKEKITRESMKNLTSLYSDRYFFHCTRTAALLHARGAPTFLYQFSYEGEHSILQAFGLPKYGQAHGDDLQYFFPYSKFPFLPLTKETGQFSQRIIKLWKSFADTGRPRDTWGESEWCPVSREEIEGNIPLKWYNLDWKPTILEDPHKEGIQFWENLLLHEFKGERNIAKTNTTTSNDETL